MEAAKTKADKYASVLLDAGFEHNDAGEYLWKRPWEKTSIALLEQHITVVFDSENPNRLTLTSVTQNAVTKSTVVLNLRHVALLKLSLRKLQN